VENIVGALWGSGVGVAAGAATTLDAEAPAAWKLPDVVKAPGHCPSLGLSDGVGHAYLGFRQRLKLIDDVVTGSATHPRLNQAARHSVTQRLGPSVN
jgi:hypothetical protein